MKYVIFDLEWNNAFDYKEQKGLNEIIEIGAVKLDEDLNIADTYTQLIKPKLSKKLSKRFVDLTSICTLDSFFLSPKKKSVKWGFRLSVPCLRFRNGSAVRKPFS